MFALSVRCSFSKLDLKEVVNSLPRSSLGKSSANFSLQVLHINTAKAKSPFSCYSSLRLYTERFNVLQTWNAVVCICSMNSWIIVYNTQNWIKMGEYRLLNSGIMNRWLISKIRIPRFSYKDSTKKKLTSKISFILHSLKKEKKTSNRNTMVFDSRKYYGIMSGIYLY